MITTTTPATRRRRRCSSSSRSSTIGNGCISHSAMSAPSSLKLTTLSPYAHVHGIRGSSQRLLFLLAALTGTAHRAEVGKVEDAGKERITEGIGVLDGKVAWHLFLPANESLAQAGTR